MFDPYQILSSIFHIVNIWRCDKPDGPVWKYTQNGIYIFDAVK